MAFINQGQMLSCHGLEQDKISELPSPPAAAIDASPNPPVLCNS